MHSTLMTMTTKTILASLLLAALILPATTRADAVRPNILFLIADDLGWADVGWHGSEIDTPHLDRLARGGVILDHHYVTPMCSSTRACLLSGRYSTRFGLDSATNSQVLPFGMTTLAGALKSLGYDTVVHQHGGELRVESREGEYTQFTVVLARR